MCSFGKPASGATSFVTLRPSVPWQLAQVAARLRAAGLSCAAAVSGAAASAAARSKPAFIPTSSYRGESLARGPLFRLLGDAQVRLGRLPALREELLRLFVVDRAGDDHVLPLFPVGGGRHPVLRGELQRVERAQHLVEVAP